MKREMRKNRAAAKMLTTLTSPIWPLSRPLTPLFLIKLKLILELLITMTKF